MPSKLGGGDYGYLPLFLTDVPLLGLPNTTAVMLPTNPANSDIVDGDSQVQSMVLKEK